MQRELIVYVDDMSGKEVDEITTVSFEVDGSAFEVDLGPDSLGDYLDILRRYAAAGRRVGRAGKLAVSKQPQEKETPRVDPIQNKAMREWWANNGVRGGLSEFRHGGRFPADVIAAYHHAGGQNLPAPSAVGAKAPRKNMAQAADEAAIRAGSTPVPPPTARKVAARRRAGAG